MRNLRTEAEALFGTTLTAIKALLATLTGDAVEMVMFLAVEPETVAKRHILVSGNLCVTVYMDEFDPACDGTCERELCGDAANHEIRYQVGVEFKPYNVRKSDFAPFAVFCVLDVTAEFQRWDIDVSYQEYEAETDCQNYTVCGGVLREFAETLEGWSKATLVVDLHEYLREKAAAAAC